MYELPHYISAQHVQSREVVERDGEQWLVVWFFDRDGEKNCYEERIS